MDEAILEWTVKVDPNFEKELLDLIRRRHLNEDDQKTIAVWIKEVEEHGPEYIRGDDKVWRDHRLSGEWIGHRTSSFSTSGRIIYRIEDEIVVVIVVRITPTHNYERPKRKKQ